MRRQRDFKLHFPPQDAGLTDVAPFWEKQLDQKKKKEKRISVIHQPESVKTDQGRLKSWLSDTWKYFMDVFVQ